MAAWAASGRCFAGLGYHAIERHRQCRNSMTPKEELVAKEQASLEDLSEALRDWERTLEMLAIMGEQECELFVAVQEWASGLSEDPRTADHSRKKPFG